MQTCVHCVSKQSIGDDDDTAAESKSSTTVEVDGEYAPIFFDPRPLRNLLAIDAMPSLCPILDLKVLRQGVLLAITPA